MPETILFLPFYDFLLLIVSLVIYIIVVGSLFHLFVSEVEYYRWSKQGSNKKPLKAERKVPARSKTSQSIRSTFVIVVCNSIDDFLTIPEVVFMSTYIPSLELSYSKLRKKLAQ